MSVLFLLKSEPGEIIKKFEFLVKDESIWKFLETFRVQSTALAANGFRKKKLGDQTDLQTISNKNSVRKQLLMYIITRIIHKKID